MTRYNQLIKRYFNFNKYNKSDYMNTYSKDENGKFTITNGYSLIRINWNLNNKTLYKRYNELEIKHLNNEYLEKCILNMISQFENGGYCNSVELKDLNDECYYLDVNKGDYSYNKKMVKSIVELIAKNDSYGVFINDENKAICITGEYGYAYLLPERVF